MWEDNKFLPILELVFQKPGKVDKINPPETEAVGILVPIHWWLENWWWTEHLNVSSCIKHGRDMTHLIYAAKRKIQNWIEYIFFLQKFKSIGFLLKASLCTSASLFSNDLWAWLQILPNNCQDPEISCHTSFQILYAVFWKQLLY